MDLLDIVALPTHIGAAGQACEDGLGQAIGLGSICLAVLALLALWAAIKVGFVGMAVWVDTMYPRASERILDAYQTPGERSFLVGLISGVVGVILSLVLIGSQVLALLGVLLLAFIAALIVVGYGVAYHNLGLRLAARSGSQSHTHAILLGGVLAESAFLVPVLGQILSLGVLFRGLGAVVVALLAWRTTSPEQTPPPKPTRGKS